MDGGAKKVNGRKRHLLVDTLGLVIKVQVMAADVGDREAIACRPTGIVPARRQG
jgi:hypothetical protein